MDKILVVDDNKYIRFALCTLLEDNGFEAIELDDGMKTVETVVSDRPDLVILDKRMPGCDGLDLLEDIRKIEKDLPVIMLTAYADEVSKERAARLGASAFMTKPFDNAEVVDTVRRSLSRVS